MIGSSLGAMFTHYLTSIAGHRGLGVHRVQKDCNRGLLGGS